MIKLVSNVKEITFAMNPELNESASSVKEICNAEQSSHVLGLIWGLIGDTLVVSRGVHRPLDKAITHETVLSSVFSAFDCNGLVAPYNVMARLLLKVIWRLSSQNRMMI